MMNLLLLQRKTLSLAEKTADFIRHEAAHFDHARIEQKGSFANLVSYVDRTAEERLCEGLKKILPEAGMLGEEGTRHDADAEYQWIVDPLDGTTNFLHQFPMFSISIGLARDKEIVLGIVYDVTQRVSYHALRGGGAYCGEKKIHVSSIARLQESLIVTGFPYALTEKRDAYWQILADFQTKTQGFRRLGSAALDLAYVATGRLDGLFEGGLQPWDVAAGALIVQEAGGQVTDFNGGDNYLYGGEICAAGPILPQMLAVIGQYW